MPQRTTSLVEAVSEGNGAQDFYTVLAYLRDTCSPSQRPLYSVMAQHCDEHLKGAALLQHTFPGGEVTFELVLLHNHVMKRFTTHLHRQALTPGQFLAIIGAK